MRSRKHNPTAAQKRWHDAVASLGSIISGGPAVLHHAIGATGKHNKIHIGEWWVIPLTDEEHKALHNGDSPWNGPRNGPWTRKGFEKVAFHQVVERLADNVSPKDYLDAGVYDAIMDYHR